MFHILGCSVVNIPTVVYITMVIITIIIYIYRLILFVVTNFSVAIFSTICIIICIIYIYMSYFTKLIWQTTAQLHRSADRTLRNTLRALNGPWSLGLALAMEVCCQGWGVYYTKQMPFFGRPWQKNRIATRSNGYSRRERSIGSEDFHIFSMGIKAMHSLAHPTWVSRIVALAALKNPPGCHWHHCTAGKVRPSGCVLQSNLLSHQGCFIIAIPPKNRK